jgi:hypothetical protein
MGDGQRSMDERAAISGDTIELRRPGRAVIGHGRGVFGSQAARQKQPDKPT